MKYEPHPYQRRATAFVLEHPFCALWMEMGLGKSVVTLTAIRHMLHDSLEVERVLVIAPKSVARNTWTDEVRKWDHLSGLSISLVMGTATQREKALASEADIYVTNRDNTVWLVNRMLEKDKSWPFDCVVLDEASSFKATGSKRWKALWRARPYIRRLVELTGTPAPNGPMDLYAQIKLLDMGKRLGRFIGQYRETWFRAGRTNGPVVYDWTPKPGAVEAISRLVEDICLSMQASDYLSLPACMDGGIAIDLPELAQYKRFEKDCVSILEDGATIEADTAAALTNKLLQWSSGAVYDDTHTWHAVSSAKLETLSDLLEQTGEPVLVYYNYVHERERILSELSQLAPVVFRGEPDILESWNAGRIRVLLAHPASVGYGLNLQHGGRIIVWYSPTWNLELYQQANARLLRQGQEKPVLLYHIVCRGTMDEAVMKALRSKESTQQAILNYLKQIINT